MAQHIARQRAPVEQDLFPKVEDGLKGLAFVDASIESARSGRWQAVELG